MTPVAYVESKEHVERLVAENDKLVIWCFTGKEKNQRDASRRQGDDATAAELASSFDSVASCTVDLSSHPDVASLLTASAEVGGEGGAWGGEDMMSLVPCGVFFNAGQLVYSVPDSTPRARVVRLVALLARSPGTLDQLRHQDAVSRRQQREREAEVNRDATVNQHEGAGVDEASAGEEGGAGKEAAVLLFIAGDRSQVGKSSTCLGLLGALLRQGLKESEVAYIKPATQCEKPQLVTAWCEMKGIACRGIGPVVFYKGFTREFLRGGAGTSEDLLQELRDAVEEISRGKKVVVVDGVGYPAVGSICGVSNGDVAAALNAPVLLVGKSGVGDAVDSYNLNACFFEARGVRVLGGVFNRISTGGFYSLERCREAVTSYFSQANPDAMPYGFVPEIASLVKPGTETTAVASTVTQAASPAEISLATSRLAGAGGAAPAAPAVAADTETVTKTVTETERTTVRAVEDGAKLAASKVPRLPVTAVESEEDLEAFAEKAGSGTLVLVDFGAEWCKNCKAILPFVHGLPERFQGGVAVATVDVDEAPELADAHGVTAIPHFLLLKSGVQVGAYAGSSESELENAVRQQLSAHSSTSTPGPSKAPAGHDAKTASEPLFVSSPKACAPGGGDHEQGRALRGAEDLVEAFSSHVDVARLLGDIREHAHTIRSSPPAPRASHPPTTPVSSAAMATAAVGSISPPPRLAVGVVGRESARDAAGEGGTAGAPRNFPRRSREEVEAEAAEQGASGG